LRYRDQSEIVKSGLSEKPQHEWRRRVTPYKEARKHMANKRQRID